MGNVSTISPKKFAELPEETRQDIEGLAKQLKQCRDNPFQFKRVLYSQLTYMYNLGLAAGLGGDVVEEGRCINIDKGEKYEITCPCCGETYDINMEAMLPKDEGFAVKI